MAKLAKVTRNNRKKPRVVFLMGLPGAGKGTQAFRLARRQSNFVHFDTGGEIYRRVTDPSFQDDPQVQKQKEVYFAGLLNDPAWVSQLVAERIRTYHKMRKSLVFSGSPRTLPEARSVLEVLAQTYGWDQTLVFLLEITKEVATQRSLARLVCANKNCRYPTTKDMAGRPCPNCGQTLPQGEQMDEKWKTELLPKRFTEYQERTRPAIRYLADRDLTMVRIDGEKREEDIEQQIAVALNREF